MTNPFATWDFQDEEQREAMMEEVTKENCDKKLRLVRDISGMSRRELAKVLAVSEATIRRLEAGGDSKPTDDFINKLRALCIIGHESFKKLSDAQKATLAEKIGVTGGAASGIAGTIAAVSAAGVIPGLSAAGITSGLAALGGGAMLLGVGVVAAVPLAAGLLGMGVAKAIKKICEENKISCEKVDSRWETSNDQTDSASSPDVKAEDETLVQDGPERDRE